MAVFKLPTGLTIYESPFLNPDGTRGVVGGPHVFSLIEKHCNNAQINMASYFTDQLRLVELSYQVNPDLHILGHKGNTEENPLSNDSGATAHTNRQIKLSRVLDKVENAGTEVSYRCINCRNCNECKSSGQIEFISIQVEIEQNIINKSVHVDIAKGITIAKLPFIVNPESKLNPNRSKALKVYTTRIKKLNKNKHDKGDVIASELKLQNMGFVGFLDNLSVIQKAKIKGSKVQYFIPWRAVWNTNSLSSPCRLVFDASLVTSSGYHTA